MIRKLTASKLNSVCKMLCICLQNMFLLMRRREDLDTSLSVFLALMCTGQAVYRESSETIPSLFFLTQ